MAAGSMSQSRNKVAEARVFDWGTEPPPPIGPSLPYRTFPNVCPPPQPAQMWGHFWEKYHLRLKHPNRITNSQSKRSAYSVSTNVL